MAYLQAADQGAHLFNAARLRADEQRVVCELLSGSSRLGARLLVRLGDVRMDHGDRHPCVLVVCDRAFNNVPQRRFFPAPYTHAVVYSNCRSGLMSEGEFDRLDFSNFADLRDLPNSDSR